MIKALIIFSIIVYIISVAIASYIAWVKDTYENNSFTKTDLTIANIACSIIPIINWIYIYQYVTRNKI